ncbi:MAG: ATPase F0F1 [Polyangiaceae bacterium]|nr:ATPase F0F1 [Polyangiaceae bacterium]
MSQSDPKPDDVYAVEVRRRVERLRRARSQATGWRHLAQVGVLAWTFVLPLLGGLVLGRLIAAATGFPAARVLGLVAGLAAGVYAAFRQVRHSLDDDPGGGVP